MRGLAPETPLLVHDTDGYIFLDIDDTIIEVHGYQKEGSGYRYSGVRGLNVLLDALKTDVSVPIIISADHHQRRSSSVNGSAAVRAGHSAAPPV